MLCVERPSDDCFQKAHAHHNAFSLTPLASTEGPSAHKYNAKDTFKPNYSRYGQLSLRRVRLPMTHNCSALLLTQAPNAQCTHQHRSDALRRDSEGFRPTRTLLSHRHPAHPSQLLTYTLIASLSVCLSSYGIEAAVDLPRYSNSCTNVVLFSSSLSCIA